MTDETRAPGATDEITEEIDLDDIRVVLTSDDGEEVEFLFFGTFDHEGVEYAMLVPAEQAGADEAELYTFRYEEDEESGEVAFHPIEDDALAWEVFRRAVELLGGQVREDDAGSAEFPASAE